MSRRFPLTVAAVALATLVAVPVASAGTGGTDRPFRATMVGESYWEMPSENRPDCGPIATFTQPTGEATHLGEITASWSHCPALPDYIGDGRLVIVAADGDELYGTYDYDPFDMTNVIPITFSGGTGRFDDASGSVEAAYSIEPRVTTSCTTDPFCFEVDDGVYLDLTVPWPWSATLTGTISY
jgi:hypothetical protein